MITSPSGAQTVSVHGQGPATETMTVAQFRDAVGYSKQTPVNATKVTLQGVVRENPPRITGLTSTDGLLGAGASGANIAPGATVTAITVAAVPPTNTTTGILGEVALSAGMPVPPPPAPTDKTLPPPPPPPAPEPVPEAIDFARIPAPIVIPDGVSHLQLSPTEPLTALAVTLPAHPVDGQVAYIFCTQEIANLVMSANEGQILAESDQYAPVPVVKPADPPLKGAPAPAPAPTPPPSDAKHGLLPARTGVGYLYSAPNMTWDRIA